MSALQALDRPVDTGRLRGFVTAFSDLLAATRDEQAILESGSALLERLIARDDWLPEAYARPHPERYQQYLLHCDSRERFSVVSFVWGPGQSTPIHDHTVWGLVGVLRGAEQVESFGRDAQGRLVSQGTSLLRTGEIDAVSPPHRRHSPRFERPRRCAVGQHPCLWRKHRRGRALGLCARRHAEKLHLGIRQSRPPQSVGQVRHAMTIDLLDRVALATPADIRTALLAGDEIAIVDVRSEHEFALGHPLFAAQIPLDRIEAEARWRIPRLATPIVVYDNKEGWAQDAARRFQSLGFTDVRLLDGGLSGWRDAGYELFEDVNSYSKAFGELVEHRRRTPALPAEDVQALIDERPTSSSLMRAATTNITR